MKQLSLVFLILMILSAIPNLLIAQNGSSANLPNRVKANFSAKYPDYTGSAQWKETAEGFQATLRHKNKEIVSEFDKEGRWVKSRTAVQESDLPASARQFLNDSYKPYEYRTGYRYDNKKTTRYELDLRSQQKNIRIEFDRSGGF